MDHSIQIGLLDLGCQLLTEQKMADYTTFRIGGNADLVVIHSVGELQRIISFLNERGQRYFVLGKGSNLLVSDNGIQEPVLWLSSGSFASCEVIDQDHVYAQAGARLSFVAETAAKNGLSGMEFAYGIPGSIGGAVTMNAGAYGGEMKDIVDTVEVLDGKNEMHVFNASEMDFGYRHSRIQKDEIVCGVLLKLNKGDEKEIRDKMNDFQQRRIDKQPLQFPSAGSVFKRPEGYFAGQLIQEAGLKGYRIGGAMVSEKHAGFIINYDHATCKDVMDLIRYVQETVYARTNLWLENEVRPVGVGIE